MKNHNKEITPEFIKGEIARARTYFLVLLYLGDHERNNQDELNDLQFKHLQHMFRLRQEGKLILNGPLLKDDRLRGICIYNCETIEEVEEYVVADPIVQAGYLKAEVFPWMGLPGDKLP